MTKYKVHFKFNKIFFVFNLKLLLFHNVMLLNLTNYNLLSKKLNYHPPKNNFFNLICKIWLFFLLLLNIMKLYRASE